MEECSLVFRMAVRELWGGRGAKLSNFKAFKVFIFLMLTAEFNEFYIIYYRTFALFNLLLNCGGLLL